MVQLKYFYAVLYSVIICNGACLMYVVSSCGLILLVKWILVCAVLLLMGVSSTYLRYSYVPIPGCTGLGHNADAPASRKTQCWVFKVSGFESTHSHWRCTVIARKSVNSTQHMLQCGYHHPNQTETSPSLHSPLSRPAHGGCVSRGGSTTPTWDGPHGPGLDILSFSTIKQGTYNNCNSCYVWRAMSFPTVMVKYTMKAHVIRMIHIRI